MYFHDVRLGVKYHSLYFWLNVTSTKVQSTPDSLTATLDQALGAIDVPSRNVPGNRFNSDTYKHRITRSTGLAHHRVLSMAEVFAS